MAAQQAERNRNRSAAEIEGEEIPDHSLNLEIATCTANRPVVPLRLQSRFLNRGSFPEFADSIKFHARQYKDSTPIL